MEASRQEGRETILEFPSLKRDGQEGRQYVRADSSVREESGERGEWVLNTAGE